MSRRAAALLWAGAATVLWLGILTGVTLLMAYVGMRLHADLLLWIGAAAGLVGATTVCSRAGRWVQALRMRGLRRRGMRAQALVERVELRRVQGRGTYASAKVWVTWPGGRGRRDFSFGGPEPADFARRCARGSTVDVLYPPGRPHRFVIDIPWPAGMVDQFS